ncbi:hypothetical protein [Streptomyces sp. WZ-12]|uniref:hypothetical protein n=1 Tax=Streptomyces sp. WZ-12 TaxID=3030210 RepID=UPI0023816DDC|nr:hypothetical protein [Streptomyces sp. WZ-12]
MDNDAQVLALLHALDQLPGPDHLEFPDGFNYPLAKSQALRLKERLSKDFGCACELDDQVQDASYCFRAALPVGATEAGVLLSVRLSNFGNLAVVTAPWPDSHDDLDHAVREGALSTADRSRIEAALRDLGYTVVPPRLLHQPYDGTTWLAGEGFCCISYGPHQGRATWWTRFFEHL